MTLVTGAVEKGVWKGKHGVAAREKLLRSTPVNNKMNVFGKNP
jgi:hypothetical protein